MTGVVLGIDPGSRKMGWALVAGTAERPRRIDGGTLRPDARAALPDRLGWLLQQLQSLFAAHPITALAVESAFVRDNPRTALVLGQARGLPIALAAARGLPVHEYAPAQVKRRIVGQGRADKHQMREMVRMLLSLAAAPPEDEADALAVALAHLRAAQWAQHVAPVLAVGRAAGPVRSAGPVRTAAQDAWLAALDATRGRRS